MTEPGPVRVVGIDDFVLLRGHAHATPLADSEARQPLDVRTAD